MEEGALGAVHEDAKLFLVMAWSWRQMVVSFCKRAGRQVDCWMNGKQNSKHSFLSGSRSKWQYLQYFECKEWFAITRWELHPCCYCCCCYGIIVLRITDASDFLILSYKHEITSIAKRISRIIFKEVQPVLVLSSETIVEPLLRFHRTVVKQ